ncbi:MAG: lysophospholipid acyltransferase family protein [Gemmatimonadaceae bacterium]
MSVGDDRESDEARAPRLLDQDLPPAIAQSLSFLERLHFSLALRMNREPVKSFWTEIQSRVGATSIEVVTGKLLEVRGFEHLEEAHRRGAVLMVANHRSYFDMFVVSSVIHRRLAGFKRLYFPVTGEYYYQSLLGMALNQFVAFWSMFPPLFALSTYGTSDRYALELVVELCAQGSGHILGIHPEGGRNLNPDPYSYLRFQPGTGKIIHAARPVVVPVFIAGLSNDIAEQVRRNWEGGEAVRIWFGEPMDFTSDFALPGKGSTYRAITNAVMERVKALGDADRASRAPTTRSAR